MLKTQEGVCFICKNPEITKFKGVVNPLSVDHCHKTGKVRSLLCVKCNALLGMADDNLEILQKAIDYLNLHKTAI